MTGVWQRVGWFLGLPVHRFSDEPAPRPIDQVIWEMAGRNPGRVSRDEALTVPAMQRGRNLICSVGTLPLVQRRADNTPVRSSLLEQIDPDVANVVTLAATIEDLLFEGISWWEILATDANGYPTSARHLDYGMVSIDPPNDGRQLNPLPAGFPRNGPTVWIDGTEVPATQVIRFDSPNPAVLKSGALALRRAIRLDMAAAMYADDPRPLDYFTPAEGADPADDDEILKILNDWRAARKKRSTAWVPSSMRYNAVDAPSPQQLQLVELQGRAALDVANMLGVDPEDLGVSTTSRTYANVNDRRIDKINDVKAPYMLAITQRLSMGDVTRRGQRVEFDLRNYLKANPTERWRVYKVRKELGTIDAAGILREEGEPPLPDDFEAPKPPPPPAPPADSAGDSTVDDATVDASRDRMYAQLRRAGLRLSAGDDGKPAMTFAGAEFAGGVEPATVDVERRTITGLALPYNKIARKYGMGFRFKPGSLEYDATNLSRIKHLMDHGTPVGIHTSVRETSRGPIVKLKVLDGPEGSPAKLQRDQLLYDAEHGLYDGLSVGVDFSMRPEDGDVEWNERDQVYDVVRASWRETSSTPMPAFDDARVTKVAASRTEGKSTVNKCATCGQEHAPGVACPTDSPTNQPAQPAGITLSQEQQIALLSQPGALQALVQAQQQTQKPADPTPAGGLTLSAEQVQGLIANGGLGVLLGVPQLTPPAPAADDKPATVDPTRRRVTASTHVSEELPYRFDRAGNLMRGATYDFSTDLVSGSKGDGEAMDRAQKFLRAQEHVFTNVRAAGTSFDTDTTDVAALNPNRQRPDMYVDQKDFTYPIWDAISKGTLADQTPFVLPKFNSSSGLVAAHTQSIEPTAGAFTATAQTITPSANSGKVEITREAWDAGGNPQLSGIIWRQMLRAWFEGLEAAAVAALDALTPTAIPLTAGGGTTGQTAVSELDAAIAGLQFVRGGMRMRDLFLQIDLYKTLVGAKDNDGRPLLPRLGAVNANGQTSDLHADLDIAGLRGRPAWALAATGAVVASSYLFDRNDVHGWASAPQRLEFQYQVKSIEIGIWGYQATANTDLTGVREITYDPVP